jgi:hypothetical protein
MSEASQEGKVAEAGHPTSGQRGTDIDRFREGHLSETTRDGLRGCGIRRLREFGQADPRGAPAVPFGYTQKAPRVRDGWRAEVGEPPVTGPSTERFFRTVTAG